MKILFVMPFTQEYGCNLSRKFISQINCTKKICSSVFYTLYDSHKVYICNSQNNARIAIGKTLPINQIFIQMHFIMRYIRKWIKDEKPDIVYIRSTPPSYTYKKTFKIMHSVGSKIVIEIPTYPIKQEAKNSSRRLFYFMVNVVRRLFGNVEKDADMFTLIGETATKYKGVNAINIENGIDINNFPIKKGFQKQENELHLLAMASITFWHGYDRVIDGMINYYEQENNSKKVILHICGDCNDGSLEKMLEKAKAHKINRYINYHGFVKGKKLDELFDLCDIAISSLGLHRINRSVDTTLKVTEYTARGIPFIYSAVSNNIDSNASYCMIFPANDSPIDINQVIDFYNSLDKKTVSNDMRVYSENTLDWSIQMEKIIRQVEMNEV